MPIRLRARLAPLLLGLAGLALAIAVPALYVERNVFDSERVADHAEAALTKPDVQTAAAADITAALVGAEPDLIAVEPVLRAAIQGVVGSEPFGSLVRSAVHETHVSVFQAGHDTLALTVANAVLLITQVLEAQAPEVAAQMPQEVETTLLSISDGPVGTVITDLAQLHHDIDVLGWTALGLALVLAGLAFALATDRRGLARVAGLWLAAVGAAGVLGATLLRAAVGEIGANPTDQAAIRALWDAFFGDLRTLAIAIAGTGLVLAAVADSLIRPVGIADRLQGLAQALRRRPARAALRALRGAALVVVGVLVLLDPIGALHLAAIALGLGLVAIGVEELLAMIDDPQLRAQAQASLGERGRWLQRRVPVAAGIGVLALLAVGTVAAVTDGAPGRAAVVEDCNGAPQLCDRRVDEVALAATHNSMSAPEEGFLIPNQQRGIVPQLESGVRALLIDTHMGVRTDRGVYTLLDEDAKSREKLLGALGPEGVATAERLRAQIGYTGGGTPEPFLCHGFCELGAIGAVEALRDIAGFMVANPGEVVVLSIEDQITPAQTARAFEESGLGDLVWRGAIEPLPTLREMIEAGERVLVFGEEETEGVDWYHDQFSTVQETPFDIDSVQGLLSPASCRRGRGREGNPILMLNHWVERVPPLPSTARQVNERPRLVGRARACERALGAFPAILAVDLWQEGDVVGAAAELNGGLAAPGDP